MLKRLLRLQTYQSKQNFNLFTSSITSLTPSLLFPFNSTPIRPMSTSPSPISLAIRKSSDRGAANHGWLNSYHSFSFAGYYDPRFESFGVLRVINEDRVTGGNGFSKHSHRDFEIFSYIVSGALKHNDSLGNEEILKRGEVQFTTTGSGIQHAEFNASKSELVHFIQMWVVPNKRGLPPKYQTKKFEDKEKEGRLRLIVSPDGKDNSAIINNDINVYASILSPQQSTSLTLNPHRQAYLHLIQDVTGFSTEANETALEVSVNGQEHIKLSGGDGLCIKLSDSNKGGEITFTGAGVNNRIAEFILFEMKESHEATEDDDHQ